MIKVIEFLKKIYQNLKKLLPLTYWEKWYYIFFYDNTIETYYIKTM